MTNEITKKDLKKYRKISMTALEIVKKNIFPKKENDAKKIIEMAECYLSDSVHFEKEGDFLNSFGAIYYAHGWIDCGVRLKIFNVDDDKLFTI